MTTDELFTAFGGREAVMAIAGVKRNAINHWHNDGVPYRHWPKLKKAAAARHIRGITDEALEGTRPIQGAGCCQAA